MWEWIMLWLLACGEGVQSVEDTGAETVVEEGELSYQFTMLFWQTHMSTEHLSIRHAYKTGCDLDQ